VTSSPRPDGSPGPRQSRGFTRKNRTASECDVSAPSSRHIIPGCPIGQARCAMVCSDTCGLRPDHPNATSACRPPGCWSRGLSATWRRGVHHRLVSRGHTGPRWLARWPSDAIGGSAPRCIEMTPPRRPSSTSGGAGARPCPWPVRSFVVDVGGRRPASSDHGGLMLRRDRAELPAAAAEATPARCATTHNEPNGQMSRAIGTRPDVSSDAEVLAYRVGQVPPTSGR